MEYNKPMSAERPITKVGKLIRVVNTAREYLRDEPFTPLDPPLTHQEMLDREEDMALRRNGRDRIIFGTRLVTTVPTEGDLYGWDGFKWDGYAAAGINAMSNRTDLAATELLTMERYRDTATGFLTAKFRLEGVSDEDYHVGKPEIYTQKKEGRTAYPQPPLGAWAVLKTNESNLRKIKDPKNLHIRQQVEDDDILFLYDSYGAVENYIPYKGRMEPHFTGLRGECEYFINHLQNSEEDPLIFITNPNATGRDWDKALNDSEGGPKMVNLPGKGKLISRINSGTRWVLYQKFNNEMAELGHDPKVHGPDVPEAERRSDWIPEQVKKKYAVNDVEFCAMHAWNLRNTADVARKLGKRLPEKAAQYEAEAIRYEEIAHSVAEEIIKRMWNPEKKFFYNLNTDGSQNPTDSITGLFPLMLDEIRAPQHRDKFISLLDKLDPDLEEGRQTFATPFPIPTHPQGDDFDPDNQRKEGADWQGPSWGITNYFLVEEGLVKQAEELLKSNNAQDVGLGKRCMKIAGWVIEQSQKMISINPETREQYNPFTGQGQRGKVFMWTNLLLHFENYEKVKENIVDERK